MAADRAESNFTSMRILPFSVMLVWPSEAALSGVRSKRSIKYPLMNMSWVIWIPALPRWMSEPLNSVLQTKVVVFS